MDFDSILHKYQQSYYKLPQSVKSFLGGIYGNIPLSVRFGSAYREHQKLLYDFLEKDTQYQLDYQYNKTLETLQFAQDHVPYYQELFQVYGFDVSHFKDFSDLNSLPHLTKEIIRDKIDTLYTDVADKPIAYYTGGSSSVPTKLYAPLSVSRAKEKVYFNYVFSLLGYRYREHAVSLQGRGNFDISTGKLWEYQNVDNYLLLSINHLQTEYIEAIYNEVMHWKPKVFYGFPSAVMLFIRACRSVDILHMENVEGVMLTSESVSWEHIDEIKTFFPKSKIISQYGHTERVVFAYREEKKDYQFLNAYGLVTSHKQEIVGTSFDNFVMPYINYKTGDFLGKTAYIERTEVVHSASSLQGRMQDFLVTKEKTLIPILSIGSGHFSNYDAIKKAQFYQDTPGKAILYLQSDMQEQIDVSEMIRQMQERTKNQIEFEIQFVDTIQDTQRHKHIFCIQKLDMKHYSEDLIDRQE